MVKLLLILAAVWSLMGCAQQVADIALGGDGATRPGVQKVRPHIP